MQASIRLHGKVFLQDSSTKNFSIRMRPILVSLISISWLLGISSCHRERSHSHPKAVPVKEAGKLELKLMSFNVRYESADDLGERSWHARIIGVVKMLRSQQPDIFGVQEAQHGQAADLWASMPDYEFYGKGRADGGKAGEYAGIFYRKDRFELDPSEAGTFWLSATPEVPGSMTWGNEFTRVVTWLRLIDRTTGRGFYVYNTHWDHRNQPSREQAARLVAQRIDSRKMKQEPVVLMGDFNSTETNPGLLYLTGKSAMLAGSKQVWKNGLMDTFQYIHASEPDRRTLHFWKGNRDGRLKVDHILVSKNARVLGAAIVSKDRPLVSDHFPVTSRVVFPSKKH